MWDRDTDFRFRFIELPRYLNTTKKNRKIGVEATVNCNLSFLVAEIFVFLNYSKIVLLRQENIRIMLAVLLLEKGQKLCSIPQIMPKIMLAQSARA